MQSLAEDFRAEVDALAGLIEGFEPGDYDRQGDFKQWTANEILRHLHFWNRAAWMQIEDEAGLDAVLEKIMTQIGPEGMRPIEKAELDGLSGRALFETWRDFAIEIADVFAAVDPKQRLKWAGPDMSARSSLTARQMEHWAHGQALFDLFGADRPESDRLRNIAHLGVSTFGWSFMVRGKPVPETHSAGLSQY